MAKVLKMRFYEVMFDVTSVISWSDENEYHLAEKFLKEMGVARAQSSDMDDKGPVFRIENVQQLHALHQFRRSLERIRPKSTEPPSLKMDIYNASTGVQMTIAWANEEEYRLGNRFLTDMGAGCGESSEDRGGKPAFFYLETKEQLESLYEFRRSLRERKRPG